MTDLSGLAAVLANPMRAAVLLALIEQGELTPGELARQMGASNSAISGHLARLADRGLVDYREVGRHRIYRPGPASAANAVRALAAISPEPPSPQTPLDPASLARTCYDHLGGRLSVALMDSILRKRYVSKRDPGYGLTRWGAEFFRGWGLNLPELGARRRAFATACLDGTERRVHLGGALGAGVVTHMFRLGWLARLPESRAVQVKPQGRAGLRDLFDIDTT